MEKRAAVLCGRVCRGQEVDLTMSPGRKNYPEAHGVKSVQTEMGKPGGEEGTDCGQLFKDGRS